MPNPWSRPKLEFIPEPQLEFCNGPTRTVGALEDPSQPKGSRDRWINNPRKPSMEFCPHGYQYSHYVKDTPNNV